MATVCFLHLAYRSAPPRPVREVCNKAFALAQPCLAQPYQVAPAPRPPSPRISSSVMLEAPNSPVQRKGLFPCHLCQMSWALISTLSSALRLPHLWPISMVPAALRPPTPHSHLSSLKVMVTSWVWRAAASPRPTPTLAHLKLWPRRAYVAVCRCLKREGVWRTRWLTWWWSSSVSQMREGHWRRLQGAAAKQPTAWCPYNYSLSSWIHAQMRIIHRGLLHPTTHINTSTSLDATAK